MHARGVELIAQVRTPRAGADLIIRPEHDVVGQQLRAPVEELGERLLSVLGVELIALLHRNPRQPASLVGRRLPPYGWTAAPPESHRSIARATAPSRGWRAAHGCTGARPRAVRL